MADLALRQGVLLQNLHSSPSPSPSAVPSSSPSPTSPILLLDVEDHGDPSPRASLDQLHVVLYVILSLCFLALAGCVIFIIKKRIKNKIPDPEAYPLPPLPEGNPPTLEGVPAPNYSPPPPLPSIKKEEKKN